MHQTIEIKMDDLDEWMKFCGLDFEMEVRWRRNE